MAASDRSEEFRRVASKETNDQDQGKMGGSAGPKRLDGIAKPRSNPMKGGGINRANQKSSLQ